MSSTRLRFGMVGGIAGWRKLGRIRQGLGGLRQRLLCRKLHVVLAIDVAIELELRAELLDRGWLAFEDEVYIEAALQRSGSIRERAALHLLHLLHFGAFLFELAFKALHD